MPPPSNPEPEGSLVIRVGTDGTPYWEAKWRYEGRQVKRRLGKAWMTRMLGDKLWRSELQRESPWVKRTGNAPADWMTEKRAVVAMKGLIAQYIEDEQNAEKIAAERAQRNALSLVTLVEAAEEWLDAAEDDARIRPGVAKDYWYALHAYIAKSPHFVGKGVNEISKGDADAWWTDLRKARHSARTRNKVRQLVNNAFNYAIETFGLPANPAGHIKRLPEPKPGQIDYYDLAEVEEVARILRSGEHRAPFSADGKTSRKPWAQAQRDVEDRQDAVFVTILALAGLRLGEARALRWKHVLFDVNRITIARSYSGGAEGPTKSDQLRSVPMMRPLAQALEDLSRRDHFIGRDDLVFVNATGNYVSDSAFRRRYKRACTKAKLRPLRVHDLRHGFLSIAAQELGAHEVQRLAGHSDVRTTARYMHAKENAYEVERLERAFAKGTPDDASLHPEPTPATST